MPPKAKITREMILDAAFTLARTEGAQAINARTVSQKLECSTQPVMYHFKTMEELKAAVYAKADAYHSEYLMAGVSQEPMREIGLNYIRFAQEEKPLFRFLFQSNEFSGRELSELLHSPELQPVLAVLCEQAGVDTEQARTIFRSLFLLVHGYASMFANNEMTYEEQVVQADLELTFAGLLYAVKGGL